MPTYSPRLTEQKNKDKPGKAKEQHHEQDSNLPPPDSSGPRKANDHVPKLNQVCNHYTTTAFYCLLEVPKKFEYKGWWTADD